MAFISDNEKSHIFLALKNESDKITRYYCKNCNYRFFLHNCGACVNRWPCPKCKKELGNVRDGEHGNPNSNTIRIDYHPITW